MQCLETPFCQRQQHEMDEVFKQSYCALPMKSIKKSTFDLPISRSEIADLIGMTAENVIRVVSDLRKDGVIEISGKQIKITDSKKPEQLISKQQIN